MRAGVPFAGKFKCCSLINKRHKKAADHPGRIVMHHRRMIVAIASALLCAAMGSAAAFDDTRYPDWRGQWRRAPVAGVTGNPSWDPNKSEGRAQQPPLNAEYQAKFEASLADQA